MKILVSKSMPRIIPPTNFGLNTLADVEAKFAEIDSSKRKVPLTIKGIKDASVYLVENDPYVDFDHVYTVDAASDQLAYFIEFVQVDVGLSGHSAVTQIALWRNRSVYSSLGMATAVFFNYLLPRFKIVMSDSLQTESGQYFWLNRMVEALRKGLYVYGYDLDTNTFTAVTRENFTQIQNHYWGTEAAHERRLVVISQQSIGG